MSQVLYIKSLFSLVICEQIVNETFPLSVADTSMWAVCLSCSTLLDCGFICEAFRSDFLREQQ